MTSIDLETMSLESRAGVFGALSDPIRLSILDYLSRDQRCVCDLQEALEIAPNLLSYHLRILRESGLVKSARRGRWVDYRLADAAVAMVAAALPTSLDEAVTR
jgi:ArsR family transcriptional regulator